MPPDRPRPLTQPELRRVLDGVLSAEVRAILRPRGFTKHGRTFRRSRGPLYDMLNFQGSTHNWGSLGHEFFVNVGVGSTEIDAVSTEWPRPGGGPIREYVLDSRWGSLIPDLRSVVSFDFLTPREDLVAEVSDGVQRSIDVVDSLATTHDLARWAARHNVLHHMEKTVAYLASVDDLPTLEDYASRIRHRMGTDRRWPAFSARFADAAGDLASSLIRSGLLDPP